MTGEPDGPEPGATNGPETGGRDTATNGGNAGKDGGKQEYTGQLSLEERECLGPAASMDLERESTIFHVTKKGDRSRRAAECLSGASLAKLALLGTLNNTVAIGDDSLSCVAGTELPGLVRRHIQPQDDGISREATAVALMAAGTFSAAHCLTDEEWERLGMSPEERKTFVCMREKGATGKTLLEIALQGNRQADQELRELSERCRLDGADDGTRPLEKRARATAAAHLGLKTQEQKQLRLTSWTEMTWTDGSMGCPQDGMVYTKALVPGVAATFAHEDRTVRVHVRKRDAYAFVPTDCTRPPGTAKGKKERTGPATPRRGAPRTRTG